ncbi:MAG TPA: OmpA family protein [Candidatus Sumerlaeota bacterium]|nr:OmpA family protein [Candidatus Sumerlaeota bacterium]HPS00117.1 OmpA family protein [Candidatus Sumerlaeota bacterium]
MSKRLRQDHSIDYWPGFTDATVSVILVLMFLIMVFAATQTSLLTSLGTRDTKLQSMQEQLNRAEEQLSQSRANADKIRRDLTQSDANMKSAFAMLDSTKSDLSRKQVELAEALERLKASEAGETKAKSDLKVTSESLAAALVALTQSKTEAQKSKVDLEEALKQIAASAQKESKAASALSVTSESLASALVNLANTQAELNELRHELAKAQLHQAELVKEGAQTSKTLATVTQEKLDLGKLVAELQRREKEITRLKDFEQYRSDFLARLSKVLGGVENVKASGDRFVFQSEVLFSSGSADLTPGGQMKLMKLVETFKELEKNIPKDIGFNIQIQGHTDTDPIVTAKFKSNWDLSTARSTEVVNFLLQNGVPAEYLSAAGYSSYYPAVPGDTPEAKQQNRRIEILFTRR